MGASAFIGGYSFAIVYGPILLASETGVTSGSLRGH
jgi:hypothetical protein